MPVGFRRGLPTRGGRSRGRNSRMPSRVEQNGFYKIISRLFIFLSPRSGNFPTPPCILSGSSSFVRTPGVRVFFFSRPYRRAADSRDIFTGSRRVRGRTSGTAPDRPRRPDLWPPKVLKETATARTGGP